MAKNTQRFNDNIRWSLTCFEICVGGNFHLKQYHFIRFYKQTPAILAYTTGNRKKKLGYCVATHGSVNSNSVEDNMSRSPPDKPVIKSIYVSKLDSDATHSLCLIPVIVDQRVRNCLQFFRVYSGREKLHAPVLHRMPRIVFV